MRPAPQSADNPRIDIAMLGMNVVVATLFLGLVIMIKLVFYDIPKNQRELIRTGYVIADSLRSNPCTGVTCNHAAANPLRYVGLDEDGDGQFESDTGTYHLSSDLHGNMLVIGTSHTFRHHVVLTIEDDSIYARVVCETCGGT